MKFNTKHIINALDLRDPQTESLLIFEKICDALELKKDIDLNLELQKIKSICPTLTDFEREFPSICFALATGIGKTRLMGALIAYLHYEKGVNNFFVMAPNLTIYNKLKDDFGNPAHHKYVFKGLDAFANSPRIIDGDNYEEFRQQSFLHGQITINIFNISKLNSESKTKDNKPARIKRLNEVLGQSYFDYLKELPDLCIMMDESHHYHADKSFDVINELKPILGVELTATPQIQKGARAITFKNVVYEYSLAHALNDKRYVKVPAVFTRKDFNPSEYLPEDLDKEKLNDGIKLHIDTKEVLDTYARMHGRKIVNPFVLVVAKDTDHSKQIMEYICSKQFFNGYYNGKVLEINSVQKGSEKDENIQKLLTLENPDNEIEIVIHVNMLKEGWDVSNLYTIIPLRTSASETLTEQTIGRGLRLPYGKRTGNEKVDRLSIVSHDKYEAIIHLANDPNSLVRKVYYIDPEENKENEQKETIELPSLYDEMTTSQSYIEQISMYIISSEPKIVAEKGNIASYIAKKVNVTTMELSKRVKNIEELKTPKMQQLIKSSVVELTKREFANINLKSEDILNVVEKVVENCIQALTDVVIAIPQANVQPIVEVKQGFYEFNLDTKNMNWHPSNDILVGQELQEDGKVIEVDTSFANVKDTDTAENAIIKHLILHDNIDYFTCADLMYKLIEQLKIHFLTYLKNDEDVAKVLVQRRRSIADNIYAQMNQHFYKEETVYKATSMRPFSRIEVGFGGKYVSDDVYEYTANIAPSEIRNKIFKGFKKSSHTMYKFDSNTERIFATVLERDRVVLKWMCPNIKQFNIYYDRDSESRYQPDFVVETNTTIYMLEIKDSRRLEDPVVVKKAKAATEYCRAVTEFNLENGGKPWEYGVISHDEVHLNSSFDYLVKNRKKYEQLTLQV
ncbi:DEAD/DEAH box helicase [Clostridium algidicarnis]|uniref:Type III restriction enzyme n=1 Tax=Clostridium algidicarnis DSM 15099 TaxID=1121295 RepID=A0A2S6G084_9CLOT|nr:DEAD/DEAH box helicase family protein [Clostridium algidicarnis]PPK49300.1 type III restriction enzyme [Clostridium algidicarnis DSM 15099]